MRKINQNNLIFFFTVCLIDEGTKKKLKEDKQIDN